MLRTSFKISLLMMCILCTFNLYAGDPKKKKKKPTQQTPKTEYVKIISEKATAILGSEKITLYKDEIFKFDPSDSTLTFGNNIIKIAPSQNDSLFEKVLYKIPAAEASKIKRLVQNKIIKKLDIKDSKTTYFQIDTLILNADTIILTGFGTTGTKLIQKGTKIPADDLHKYFRLVVPNYITPVFDRDDYYKIDSIKMLLDILRLKGDSILNQDDEIKYLKININKLESDIIFWSVVSFIFGAILMLAVAIFMDRKKTKENGEAAQKLNDAEKLIQEKDIKIKKLEQDAETNVQKINEFSQKAVEKISNYQQFTGNAIGIRDKADDLGKLLSDKIASLEKTESQNASDIARQIRYKYLRDMEKMRTNRDQWNSILYNLTEGNGALLDKEMLNNIKVSGYDSDVQKLDSLRNSFLRDYFLPHLSSLLIYADEMRVLPSLTVDYDDKNFSNAIAGKIEELCANMTQYFDCRIHYVPLFDHAQNHKTYIKPVKTQNIPDSQYLSVGATSTHEQSVIEILRYGYVAPQEYSLNNPKTEVILKG